VYAAREGVPADHALALFRSRRVLGRAVPATVLYLGLTSLFTDISSEMVSAVLPLYAIFFLQLTPLQFGFLDGIYQGAAGLVRLIGGVAGDRTRRHKEVATAGYAMSAVSKLGLLLAGPAFWPFAAALLVDRSGKAIRTAPRDALISLATPAADLAGSFAVHRAMDTFGALAGPLVAFGLLSLAPGRFDAVFVVSFCVALVGLGVIGLFVENRPAEAVERVRAAGQAGIREVFRRPAYATLVAVAGVLAVCTVSDGFLYLTLQRRLGFSAGIFPLLYVATSLFYFLLAVPAGRIADRVGRVRVFIAGYLLLPVVYAAALMPDLGYPLAIGALFLFGAYYAATDGVLAAIGSSLLGPAVRGTGLSVLSTAVAVGRLVASIVFGAVWTIGGLELALGAFTGAILLVVAVSAVVLRRAEIHSAVA
jgi:MFS family permease